MGGVSLGMPVPGSSVDEMEVEESDSSEKDSKEKNEGGSAVASPRIVAVSVESFKFSPATLSLKKGEKVSVRLTGVSGNHGFAVPELGINTAISEGKTVDVSIPTEKTGTFTFFCSIPCGSGHRDMKGTITIQ